FLVHVGNLHVSESRLDAAFLHAGLLGRGARLVLDRHHFLTVAIPEIRADALLPRQSRSCSTFSCWARRFAAASSRNIIGHWPVRLALRSLPSSSCACAPSSPRTPSPAPPRSAFQRPGSARARRLDNQLRRSARFRDRSEFLLPRFTTLTRRCSVSG